MKRFRSLFVIAAAALALTGSASAATLTYTFAGGAATGSLNGVSFTATSFSITATGDSSAVQSGLFEGFSAQSTSVSAPFVQINTTSGPITTTLISETSGYLWRAASLDYGGLATVYGFVLGEALANWDTNNMLLYIPPVSPDLSTPATYSGIPFAFSSPVPTSDGPLQLNDLAASTSFTISAVPEPATATSSLLLSLGGLSLISRRNRKA